MTSKAFVPLKVDNVQVPVSSIQPTRIQTNFQIQQLPQISPLSFTPAVTTPNQIPHVLAPQPSVGSFHSQSPFHQNTRPSVGSIYVQPSPLQKNSPVNQPYQSYQVQPSRYVQDIERKISYTSLHSPGIQKKPSSLNIQYNQSGIDVVSEIKPRPIEKE